MADLRMLSTFQLHGTCKNACKKIGWWMIWVVRFLKRIFQGYFLIISEHECIWKFRNLLFFSDKKAFFTWLEGVYFSCFYLLWYPNDLRRFYIPFLVNLFNSNDRGFILLFKWFPAILFRWVLFFKICLEIIRLLLL